MPSKKSPVLAVMQFFSTAPLDSAILTLAIVKSVVDSRRQSEAEAGRVASANAHAHALASGRGKAKGGAGALLGSTLGQPAVAAAPRKPPADKGQPRGGTSRQGMPLAPAPASAPAVAVADSLDSPLQDQ